MFKYLKKIWIINKAFSMTVKHFKHLRIGNHFWYGTPKTPPYAIGFWIFFKTDQELQQALASGTSEKIREFLFEQMKKMGYPLIAFEKNTIIYEKQYVVINGEKIQDHTPTDQTTCISFGSEETVKRDYGGDYYTYTK